MFQVHLFHWMQVYRMFESEQSRAIEKSIINEDWEFTVCYYTLSTRCKGM